MKFKLSNEDISLGVRANAESCPYARCLKRTLGSKAVVRVYGDNAIVDGKQLILPPEVARDIREFDQGTRPLERLFEMTV